MGRFLTRDTWEGNARKPSSYNAWLYTYGNPINMIDPSGHDSDCSGYYAEQEQCKFKPPSQFASSLANFVNDNTDTIDHMFSEQDEILIDDALWTVAGAYSRAYSEELVDFRNSLLMDKNLCADSYYYLAKSLNWSINPYLAFTTIHEGKITFEKYYSTGEWAQVSSLNHIMVYNGGFFSNSAGINPGLGGQNVDYFEKRARYKRFITHETGHAFDNATDIIGNQLGRNAVFNTSGKDNDVLTLPDEGFAGSRADWQWRLRGWDDQTELFADMFVGWVYGSYATNPDGSFTTMGQRRHDFMDQNMKGWVFDIVNVRLRRK